MNEIINVIMHFVALTYISVLFLATPRFTVIIYYCISSRDDNKHCRNVEIVRDLLVSTILKLFNIHFLFHFILFIQI